MKRIVRGSEYISGPVDNCKRSLRGLTRNGLRLFPHCECGRDSEGNNVIPTIIIGKRDHGEPSLKCMSLKCKEREVI